MKTSIIPHKPIRRHKNPLLITCKKVQTRIAITNLAKQIVKEDYYNWNDIIGSLLIEIQYEASQAMPDKIVELKKMELNDQVTEISIYGIFSLEMRDKPPTENFGANGALAYLTDDIANLVANNPALYRSRK